MFRFFSYTVLCIGLFQSSFAVHWLKLPGYKPIHVLSVGNDIWFNSDTRIVDYTTQQVFDVKDNVNSLASDPQGRIWYGANGNIGYVYQGHIRTLRQGTFYALSYDQGAMWFLYQRGNEGTIYASLDSQNNMHTYKLPAAFKIPGSLTAGSDGNLWITDYIDKLIAKIVPNHAISVYHVPVGPFDITSADSRLWYMTENGYGVIDENGKNEVYTLYNHSVCAGSIIPGPNDTVIYVLDQSVFSMYIKSQKKITLASFPDSNLTCGETTVYKNQVWIANNQLGFSNL